MAFSYARGTPVLAVLGMGLMTTLLLPFHEDRLLYPQSLPNTYIYIYIYRSLSLSIGLHSAAERQEPFDAGIHWLSTVT